MKNQNIDEQPDHDQEDIPQGTDPLIRRDRGVLFFLWEGSWYQVGTLPTDARVAYLQEESRRAQQLTMFKAGMTFAAGLCKSRQTVDGAALLIRAERDKLTELPKQ